jgi:hypothetical protein
MSELPRLQIDERSRPYWDGLIEGKLLFQHCHACGKNWLPARECCPQCLSPDAEWRQSAGTGKIISFVVYHVAYHDAFKDRLPYDVTLVELDEGPRLVTNIVDSRAGAALRVDARVRLAIQREGGIALARFRLAEAGEA